MDRYIDWLLRAEAVIWPLYISPAHSIPSRTSPAVDSASHCTLYSLSLSVSARVWSTLHVCGMDRSCATTTCSMRFVFNSLHWSEASRASSSCPVTSKKSSSASTTLVSPPPGRRLYSFEVWTVRCLELFAFSGLCLVYVCLNLSSVLYYPAYTNVNGTL